MYGRSALGSTTQQESSINAGGINGITAAISTAEPGDSRMCWPRGCGPRVASGGRHIRQLNQSSWFSSMTGYRNHSGVPIQLPATVGFPNEDGLFFA
jgi:hypothetical protein